MTIPKNKKMIKPMPYTFLTSTDLKINYFNSFLHESGESETLKALTQLFQTFGKIEKLESHFVNKDEIRNSYKRYFPNSENVKDHLMKSQLRNYLKKQHLNKPENQRFWSHFVFGFNEIVKKIENGVQFELILVDKSIEDAPIVRNVRELAIGKGNADLILTVFGNDRLVESINSDSKQFGKILMVAFIKGQPETVEISKFKNLFKSKINLEISLPIEEIVAPLPDVNVEPEPVKVESRPQKRNPYVTDVGEISMLLASHDVKSTETTSQEVKDIDFLSNLKRVTTDVSQTTKYIQPPQQQKKRKLGKC